MSDAVRLVIFDFDGVLANTEDLHRLAFDTVLREQGVELPPEEYYRHYLGLPDGPCLSRALASKGRRITEAETEALVQRKRAAFAEIGRSAALFPGVVELLRALEPRLLLAIASGAFRDEIESVLDRAGVRELFAAIVAAEDVERGKPAPDPFLRALAAVNHGRGLALTPGQCVVVEDAPHGVEAARAAAMRCIGVTTSHDREALKRADAVVASVTALAETPDLLA